jgi:hypothetical protein
MKLRRLPWLVSIACAVASQAAEIARGQAHPLTLMQWSYPACDCEGDSACDLPPIFEPIATDRPHFTKVPSVVGLGVLQLETGYTYGHESGRGNDFHDIHSFPEALVRVGALAEWLEFRFGWTWVEQRSRTHDSSDASDPEIGVKIALTPQEQFLPESAVVIHAALGSDLFDTSPSLDGFDPGADFLYSWELSEAVSTGGATQFHRRHAGRAYTEFSQSWILERSFTDEIEGYGEWFMLAPDGADFLHTQHYADGGILYQFTPNVQCDVSAGCGLNDAALDFFVGAGFSIRR